MFRQTKQRRVQKHFTDTVIIPSGTEYPFRLNFYTTPPLREVTLEDFELWAIDRLHGKCLAFQFDALVVTRMNSFGRNRVFYLSE